MASRLPARAARKRLDTLFAILLLASLAHYLREGCVEAVGAKGFAATAGVGKVPEIVSARADPRPFICS